MAKSPSLSQVLSLLNAYELYLYLCVCVSVLLSVYVLCVCVLVECVYCKKYV